VNRTPRLGSELEAHFRIDMRLFASVLMCLAAPAFSAPGPTIAVTEIATPAAAGSLGGALTRGPDGTVWLSWIEPAPGAKSSGGHAHAAAEARSVANALKFSTFDAARGSWRASLTILTDKTVAPSSLDFPQLAIDGAGAAFALWTDGQGGARIARSTDRGISWSAPQPWTDTDHGVEKFALERCSDGRVLVAWLDGRGHKIGGKMQQMYARFIDEPETNDQLIDASVCDCCQTALAPFLDGGALAAYRARTDDEIRDIRVARRRSTTWEPSQALGKDGWRIKACPMNGPRLSTDGSRVAAGWYTATDNQPRVYVSYSPDAGGRWLMPLRVDGGKPAGHVDVALLRDGAIVAVWLENDGSLWLRRITPEYAATPPVQLAPADMAAIRAVPRIAMLRDYAGERSNAQLLVGYTRQSEPAGVRTLLVTVPEGELLIAERNCNCTPSPDQLQGFPLRGTVTRVDAAANRVSVRHLEVPGVFAGGSHDFYIAPATLPAIQPGHDFLGRIERQDDGTWWLFAIQSLAEPVRSR
jgi:hypothetical protein